MSGIDVETKEAVDRLKKRLSRYYAHYNPANLEKLDEILVAYDYDADELFDDLTQVYGPEPADDDVVNDPPTGVSTYDDSSAATITAVAAVSEGNAPVTSSSNSHQPLPIKEDSPVPEVAQSVLPSRASADAIAHGSRRQSTSEGSHVSRSVSQRDRLAAERKALQAEREEFAPLLQEHDSPLPIAERSRQAMADLEEKRRMVETLHKQEIADYEDDEHTMRRDIFEEEADSRSVLKSLSRDQKMLAEGVAARRERESQVDRERLERATKEEASRKQRVEEERAFAVAEAERVRRLEELDEKVRAAEEEAARKTAIGYDNHPDVLVVKHDTAVDEGINQTPPRGHHNPPTTATNDNNAVGNVSDDGNDEDAASAGGVSELTGSNAAEPIVGKAMLSSITASTSDGNTVWRQPPPPNNSHTPDALADFHRRPASSKKQHEPRTSTTSTKNKKPNDFAEGAPGWLNVATEGDSGKVGRKDSFRGDPVVTEDDDDDEDIVVSRRSYPEDNHSRSVSATSSAIRWAKAAGGGPSSISPAPARPVWRGDGDNDLNSNNGPSHPIVWGSTNATPHINTNNNSEYLSPASQRVAMASYAVYQNRTEKVGAATAQELLNRAKGHIQTTTPHKSSHPQYNRHVTAGGGEYDDVDDGAASDNDPAYKMFLADARRGGAADGTSIRQHPNNNNNNFNGANDKEDYDEIIEDYDGGRRSASVVHHHHHRHVVEVIHKNDSGAGDGGVDMDYDDRSLRDRSISGVSSGDGKHTIQKILQQLSSTARRPASTQIRPVSVPRASTPQQQANEYMFPINRTVIKNTTTSQQPQRAGSNAGGLYLAPEDFQRYHYPTGKFTPVALLNNNNNASTTPRRHQGLVASTPHHWGASTTRNNDNKNDGHNAARGNSSGEYERARTSSSGPHHQSSSLPPRADNLPDFYQGERPRLAIRDARRPVAVPPPHISSLLTPQGGGGGTGGISGYRGLKGTPWRNNNNEGNDNDRPRGPSSAYHQISPTTGRPLRVMEVAAPAPGPDFRAVDSFDEDDDYDHINDDDLVHDDLVHKDDTNNPRYNRKPRNVNVRARDGGNRYTNNYGDPNKNSFDEDDISRTPSVAETVLEVGVSGGGGDRVLRCAYEEGQMPPSPFIVASHVRGDGGERRSGAGVPSLTSSGVNKIYPASYFNDPNRLLEGSDARGANKVGFNRGAFEYGGAAYITTTTTVAPSSHHHHTGGGGSRGVSPTMSHHHNNTNTNRNFSNANNSTNMPMVTTQQWMPSARGGVRSQQVVGSSTNTFTPTRGVPPASAVLLGQSSSHGGGRMGVQNQSGGGSAPTPFRVTSTKSTPTAVSGW